jgi:sialate O-acetylesterase
MIVYRIIIHKSKVQKKLQEFLRKKMSSLTLLIVTIFIAISYVGAANMFLAKSLGSNMVFQRDAPFKLSGYASLPAAEIYTRFNGYRYRSISSSDASVDGGFFWMMELPATRGGFNKFVIDVTSSSGERATLNNVVFGDVYLCTGQSNMQMSMPAIENAEAEILDAQNYPFIRVFNVGQDLSMPQATAPLDDLYSYSRPGTANASWTEGSSQAVTDEQLDHWYFYSGVCWMFAKNLYVNTLSSQIPVGVISSCWGGTVIEAWSPPEVMQTCNDSYVHVPVPNNIATSKKNVDNVPIRRDNKKKEQLTTDVDPNANSVLYNTMIAPLRNLRFSGVVWYQGESNVAYGGELYACLQDAMVNSWRKLFNNDFAFVYTQLSTWNGGGEQYISTFRIYQTTILTKTSRSAMITAADLGDPDSPDGDIHPRKKSEVGRRASLAMSTLVYNVTVPSMGPLVEQKFSFVDEIVGLSGRVVFMSASSGPNGLVLKAPQTCPDESLCGVVNIIYTHNYRNEQKIVLASISLSGPNTVDFKPSATVDESLWRLNRVEYCLGDYPMMTIYNSQYDIPLLPDIIYF